MRKPIPCGVDVLTGVRKRTIRDHRRSSQPIQDISGVEVKAVKDFAEIRALFQETKKVEKMNHVEIENEFVPPVTPGIEDGDSPFGAILGDIRVAALNAMSGENRDVGLNFTVPVDGATLDDHRTNTIKKLKAYAEKDSMKLSTKIALGLGGALALVFGIKRMLR